MSVDQKKPISREDLEKALEKFPKSEYQTMGSLKAISTTWKGESVQEWLTNFKELFSAFQRRHEECEGDLISKIRQCEQLQIQLESVRNNVWNEADLNGYSRGRAEAETEINRLLEDFGDLADYDNDDVFDLVNGLKELLEASGDSK